MIFFAQLAFPLVWNLWGTEEISVLSAIATIILKSLLLDFPDSYIAMLSLQCCQFAASLFCNHLISEAKKLSRLRVRGGGHRGRERVQQVRPETGVQLLILINERQQGTHLMGHQSYLNPQLRTVVMVCIKWRGRVARCLSQLFVWHPL